MIVRYVDVSKHYESAQVAVHHVSLEIPNGQFCVVLGPSGAGKSTLLRMVNGLTSPTDGYVEFGGRRIEAKSLKAIRPQIGMIHQQFHLVPRLSVIKNVLAGALPKVSTLRALSGFFPNEYRRRACRLISEVGLQEKHLYRRATHLSGGEQQRVAIARAFMLEPKLILADEPVASLDPSTSESVLDLLKNASRQHDATVLCCLHQVELARQFADRIVSMRQGRVVFDGSPSELSAQELRDIYESSEDRKKDESQAR